MPKLNERLPKYRLHRHSGQAIVSLNGEDHYLGPYGSDESRALHIAAGHDRPESWTCDDVESARLAANALARPWGRRPRAR